MFNKTLNNEGNKKTTCIICLSQIRLKFSKFLPHEHSNSSKMFMTIKQPSFYYNFNAPLCFHTNIQQMYLLKPWSWIFQRVWRSCFPDQSLRPSPTPIGLHYYTALSPSWRLFSLATTDLEYKMQLVSIKLKIQRYSHQCLSFPNA